MTPAVVLCAGNLAHGIVEGVAEDLDVEVNGVAGGVLDEETVADELPYPAEHFLQRRSSGLDTLCRI